MDYIIIFFRDILSGPLYIVDVAISSFFLCACIGYFGERYLNKKNEKNKANNFASVSNNNSGTQYQQSAQSQPINYNQVNNNQVVQNNVNNQMINQYNNVTSQTMNQSNNVVNQTMNQSNIPLL